LVPNKVNASIISCESLDLSGATNKVSELAIADSNSSLFVRDFEPGSETLALNGLPKGAGQ
jgi:hypothetical protein